LGGLGHLKTSRRWRKRSRWLTTVEIQTSERQKPMNQFDTVSEFLAELINAQGKALQFRGGRAEPDICPNRFYIPQG
jgi:hypothetical protein